MQRGAMESHDGQIMVQLNTSQRGPSEEEGAANDAKFLKYIPNASLKLISFPSQMDRDDFAVYCGMF